MKKALIAHLVSPLPTYMRNHKAYHLQDYPDFPLVLSSGETYSLPLRARDIDGVLGGGMIPLSDHPIAFNPAHFPYEHMKMNYVAQTGERKYALKSPVNNADLFHFAYDCNEYELHLSSISLENGSTVINFTLDKRYMSVSISNTLVIRHGRESRLLKLPEDWYLRHAKRVVGGIEVYIAKILYASTLYCYFIPDERPCLVYIGESPISIVEPEFLSIPHETIKDERFGDKPAGITAATLILTFDGWNAYMLRYSRVSQHHPERFGIIRTASLFLPNQWNLREFISQHQSQIRQALDALDEGFQLI